MPQGIFFERKGRDGCAVRKWSACCLSAECSEDSEDSENSE